MENGLEMSGKLSTSVMYYCAQAVYNHFEIDKDLVGLMLEAGGDINCDSNEMFKTPLHFACQMGNEAVVALLITFKANLNCVDKDSKMPINYALEQDGNNFFLIESML